MFKQIQNLTSKHREVLMYLVFGVLTTVVNYIVYLVWIHAFPGKTANVAGVIVAWIISVLFAYFTNRKWVFRSIATGFLQNLRECLAFFSGRAATGLLDLVIMYVTVDLLHFNGGIMKLVSNVIVIVLNYVLSKTVVFRKRG